MLMMMTIIHLFPSEQLHWHHTHLRKGTKINTFHACQHAFDLVLSSLFIGIIWTLKKWTNTLTMWYCETSESELKSRGRISLTVLWRADVEKEINDLPQYEVVVYESLIINQSTFMKREQGNPAYTLSFCPHFNFQLYICLSMPTSLFLKPLYICS